MKEVGGEKGGKDGLSEEEHAFLDLDHQLTMWREDLRCFQPVWKWNILHILSHYLKNLTFVLLVGVNLLLRWYNRWTVIYKNCIVFCAHTYIIASADASKAFTWKQKKTPATFSSLCQPWQMHDTQWCQCSPSLSIYFHLYSCHLLFAVL